MKESNLKNMVILKDLPSNIVEEAIVILKSNKKAKKLEKIERNKKAEKNTSNRKKDKTYILKEAEMIVSSYISEIEGKKHNKEVLNKKVGKKYKKLRAYAYISSIIIIVQTIILLIK